MVVKNIAVISGRFSQKYCNVRWLIPRSAAQMTNWCQAAPFVRTTTAMSATVASDESRVSHRPATLLVPTQRKTWPWTHGARAP